MGALRSTSQPLTEQRIGLPCTADRNSSAPSLIWWHVPVQCAMLFRVLLRPDPEPQSQSSASGPYPPHASS